MRTQRAANAALWAIIVFLAALALVTVALPALRGWQGIALTGQSMEPTIPMGSMVFVDPAAEVGVGSVITFDQGNRLWTHRIVKETHARRSFDIVAWQTKGDNPNLSNDPFLVETENIRGVVVGHVPLLGYASLFIRTPASWLFVLILSLFLLWLSRAPSATDRRISEMKRQREEANTPTPQYRLDAIRDMSPGDNQ